jgi:hypothetical protein
MQYCRTGQLGRIKCVTFSTKLTENLVQWANLSGMHKCGMGREETNSLNFDSEFNSSWESFQPIKRGIFPRGDKEVAMTK